VKWLPLVGDPLERRAWLVWPADSRKRDVADLILALEAAAASVQP
jgi:hypothetical protein